MKSYPQSLSPATGEVDVAAERSLVNKEWTKPELIKVDLQEITANGDNRAADGGLSS